MLQVLSWNAYNHNTPPHVSNVSSYLPTPDTPRMSSPAPSKLTKRKRSPEGDSESRRQDSVFDRSLPHIQTGTTQSVVPAHSAPPAIELIQQPSDGLPTPLLSPTALNMDDKSMLDVPAEPVKVESSSARRNKIRQVALQQINLEILNKHNELRLIEQEIAKCQTAREQLRRCTEIPYPATQLSQEVSTGTGPALRQSFAGARLPASPAPWGVTDGPYSRHYAAWLLPDARFDGGEPDSALSISLSSKRPAKGRHGRPSIVEDMQHAGMSSRSQRNNSLQSLPQGYAPAKEKSNGPCVVKRSSDGKDVKLKCLDCGRYNFGSAQGFINHCRIGHHRTFASHDAAAEQCGELVEYDASGTVIGGEPTKTVTTSIPVTMNFTHVQPLVRSAHTLSRKLGPAPSVPQIPSIEPEDIKFAPQPAVSGLQGMQHLQALIKNKGLGLDLQGAVTDAKTKLELADSDVEMSDVEEESKSPDTAPRGHPKVGGTRQIGAPSKALTTSPFLGSRIPSVDGGMDFGHPIEPSPTTDSNQAPSLIDDDEEYEAHSPASTPASELADDEYHIHVQDDDEAHQVELSRPEFQPNCASAPGPVSSSPARRPSAFRKETESHEEKHVSFDNAGSTEERDSKRRKITK
jgi:ADA HAT complex component 1